MSDDLDLYSPYHDGSMQHDKDGGWVSYDDYKERIEELEAKLSKSEALLAKAVDNLASVMSQYDRFREDEYAVGLAPLDSAIETARTTLAELKGEKHE